MKSPFFQLRPGFPLRRRALLEARNMRATTTLSLLCLAFIAGPGVHLFARTLTVDGAGSGDFTRIQPAIDAAADGDTVLVNPGVYEITAPITFRGKALALRAAEGPGVTTIRVGENPDDPGRASVVVFEDGEVEDSVLEGFTLTGGTARLGGGVHCGPGTSPALIDCAITGNRASVECDDSGPPGTEMDCTVAGGGVYCATGAAPRLAGCTISGNSSEICVWMDPVDDPVCLGAFCNDSPPYLACSDAPGGGVYGARGSLVTLDDCTIAGNVGTGVHGTAATMTLIGCTITGNTGAGVRCDDGPLTLADCTVSGNSGDGVQAAGDFPHRIERCALAANAGRGLRMDGSSSVVETCSITGNTGGGVGCPGGSATAFVNCAIAENSVAGEGGGVHCSDGSAPTFSGCTISRNEIAANRASAGAGLYAADGSSPVLESCAITACSGSGVHAGGSSSPALRNCVISGCSASGVSADGHAFPSLVNCTISGNLDGGLSSSGASSPELVGCIVWDNVGGSIAASEDSAPRVAHSSIEGDAIWPGEGNINRDPLFGGWGVPGEVYVDSASPGPGDGTAAAPWPDLAAALEYSLALRPGSPCLGTGVNGENMGADTGVCEAPSAPSRLVHLAPGSYSIQGLNLVHRVSLQGAGAEQTVIEGTIFGLRTGSRLSYLTVTKGTAGGIVVTSGESPEIAHCTIRGNASPGNTVSGVTCVDSSPILTDCIIAGNAAVGGGGLRCFRASPALTGCTIFGNLAHAGGGIRIGKDSSPVLVNCRILGNSASQGAGGKGGGAHFELNSEPTLINCVVAGNLAAESGGGISCTNGARPALINCTIAGNRAPEGGGLHAAGGAWPEIENCIFWGNDGESIALGGDAGALVRHSCLAGDPVWPGAGNSNRDPLFASSGIFDFESFATVVMAGIEHRMPEFIVHPADYRLLPGSPAIDAGLSNGAPATDIDGNGRPCGDGVDMGAHEAGDCRPSLFRFIRGDCNLDRRVDISDAVCSLDWLFQGGAAPGCVAATDVNSDGSADIADALFLLGYLFLSGRAPDAPFPDCGPALWAADQQLGCATPCGEPLLDE
jgi:hypothetical protein